MQLSIQKLTCLKLQTKKRKAEFQSNSAVACKQTSTGCHGDQGMFANETDV